MHLSTQNALILVCSSLLTQRLVGAQSNNGPCVQSCFTTNPVSSTCNGDETGQALDQCTCASLSPGNSLITCIKACPSDQQSTYAGHLPELCRGTLFPNLSVSTTANGASTSSSSEASMTNSAAVTSGSTDGTASATGSASSIATPSGNAAGGNVFDTSIQGFTATLLTGISALLWYL